MLLYFGILTIFIKGLSVIQLLPGRDIAISRRLSPIQNKINQFAIEMRNFIYIIADTDSRQCVVVDACWDTAGIIKIIKKHNLTLIGMIVTHYHFDHVGGIPPPPFDQFRIKVSGLATMLKKYPHIKAYIHVNDIPYLKESNPNISNDQIYPTIDDLEITLGTRTHLKFIHTPGHSSGSQCILVNGKRLISGDTLFIGNCGRLDLPGADPRQMYDTLQKLRSLPDFVVVLPGHNYGGDWTTINQEKEIGVLKEQTYEEWIKKKHAALATSEHHSSGTASFDSGVHHV
jgi:glyoxylase-like metal-dependent hydrolase (beta-lactamase superfamily II)